MKSALTLFFSFIACLQGFAQIDISFLSEKSSNAILLRDRTEFNIFKDNKSSLKRNYEAVIKNGHASSLTNVVIHYDQFQKVKHAEIVLKSLDGKVIEEYKLRDFEDWTTDFSGVASDARAKVLKPVYSRYPYVISVSYEVEKEGSLHYPIWMPQSAEKLRVISAKFVVNDYENNAFRYEAKNVQKPEITTLVDRKTYVWKVKDLDPFEVEKYSYSIEEYAPVVYTAPTVFQMEYYRGDMHTWNSFGKWIQKLNAGKNDLDGTDLTDLDQLVAQAGSAEEKVKIV
ncbi:MAG: DUF3857 domain-containing protein, partial [Fulvivirga sp.]|nr:DUF3857 domain-containing protein [Fulvivirga sp.]